MTDIFQYSFWTDEEKRHFAMLAPYIIEILFRGAVGGVDLLPEEARVLMNWDVYNQAALDWLNDWRGGMLREMDEYTRTRTVQEIVNWVKAGDPLPVLEKRLSSYLFSKSRAQRIAVTEVTRMYAEGNLMAWRASSVVGAKRWMTAMDERVCPICRPLNGTVVSLDGSWSMSNGRVIEGLGITAPPAHISCRCWLQPIVDLDLVSQNFRRILEQVP